MFVDPFAEVEEELTKEREAEIEKVSFYLCLLLSLFLVMSQGGRGTDKGKRRQSLKRSVFTCVCCCHCC